MSLTVPGDLRLFFAGQPASSSLGPGKQICVTWPGPCPSQSFGHPAPGGWKGCQEPSLPYLWRGSRPGVLIPEIPPSQRPLGHPAGLSPGQPLQRQSGRGRLCTSSPAAPPSRPCQEWSGGRGPLGNGEGRGGGQGPLCSPGSPPPPPPACLAMPTAGQEGPVGHPSGRQSGPKGGRLRRGAGEI